MTQPPQPPAGWYADPSEVSGQRYWDGAAWTNETTHVPTPTTLPVGQPATPAKSNTTGKVLLAIAGLIVGGTVFSIIDSGGTSTQHASSTASTAPAASWSTPEAEQSPYTNAQQQAIKKAESYLSYSAFSKLGLINQLEYEQFSTADATFAVQQIEDQGRVNWNDQAVKKAKSYLSYSSFSQSGLANQLEYEKFTPEQAQHGAAVAYGS